MDLTDEQKETVRRWAAEGASIGQMQNRLREELGIALSYMETRLLVGELNVKLAEKAEPAVPGASSLGGVGDLAAAPATGGRVSVTIDELTPPHAALSGKVTFSDGTHADWHLDKMGRLALNPSKPGYRPAEADVVEFQRELARLVEKRGL